MVATPPLRMLGGLSSAPMEASPEFCSYSRNFVNREGRLRVRPGMRHVQTFGTWYTGTDPSSLATVAGVNYELDDPVSVSVGTVSAGFRYLFIGFRSRPICFDVYAESWTSSDVNYSSIFFPQGQRPVYAWDGSAWTQVGCGDRTGSSSGAVGFTGVFAPARTSCGSSVFGYGFRGVISEDATWEAKTINGVNAYYMCLDLGDDIAAADSAPVIDTTLTRATYTEDRVQSICAFRQFNGARHVFQANLKSTLDGMRFILDGTELAASDGLAPSTGAEVFEKTQTVTTLYHRSSDRVIGCIESFGMFYLIPTESIVYPFIPDSVGTDTPYQGLIGGLRSSVPAGSGMVIYDDRLFTWDGSILYYSAPREYPDIWANDWEIPLGDGGGPIIGAAVVGGVLAVFKRNSVFVVQASGDADSYGAFQLPSTVGCISPRAIWSTENAAYFASEDGIYQFNGAELTKLSERVDAFYAGMQYGVMENSMAVFSTANDEFRLFYPAAGDPPGVCRHALYMSTRGDAPAFWPQGPVDAEDCGFQATAVAVDQTQPYEVVYLGDRYGNLWEMDLGRMDVGDTITAEIVSARVNVGTSSKAMARWVTPTVHALASQDVTVEVFPDDIEAAKATLTFDQGGANAATGFFVTGALVDTADTVQPWYEVQALPSGSAEVVGRFFRVRLEAGCPFEMEAIEFEFTPIGRRG